MTITKDFKEHANEVVGFMKCVSSMTLINHKEQYIATGILKMFYWKH